MVFLLREISPEYSSIPKNNCFELLKLTNVDQEKIQPFKPRRYDDFFHIIRAGLVNKSSRYVSLLQAGDAVVVS